MRSVSFSICKAAIKSSRSFIPYSPVRILKRLPTPCAVDGEFAQSHWMLFEGVQLRNLFQEPVRRQPKVELPHFQISFVLPSFQYLRSLISLICLSTFAQSRSQSLRSASGSLTSSFSSLMPTRSESCFQRRGPAQSVGASGPGDRRPSSAPRVAQFVVDQRQEPAGGGCVALLDRREDSGHVAHGEVPP